MGSANSAAFLQGQDDFSSAAQMCPFPLKTVALYPVRWAISQEETALPDGFTPPDVALEKAHYCLRTLKTGWVYLYSESYQTLHEYRVGEEGVIKEVKPGENSVLLPEVDAESALPCIHHPAAGKVYLKFVPHRWTGRLQSLIRLDASVRNEYMQGFDLDGLVDQGQKRNIAETEKAGPFIEEFRQHKNDFDWSLTECTNGISGQDFQGVCKKATEFSYCVALDDEIGITAELGQLHALYVNLIANYTEENIYPYTTARLVDALIEHEAAKEQEQDEREEIRSDLKARVRMADKQAFMDAFHRQLEPYEQERSRVFEDWKRWIGSAQIAKKVELHDIHSPKGFEAVEMELADILDGYVGVQKGKEEADRWFEAEDGEAGPVGNMLKTVLFLVPAAYRIADKLNDLPEYEYGHRTIVNNLQEMPGFLGARIATDTLLLEFATPAAQMGAWAKSPQTKSRWTKWRKNVAKRYKIEVYQHEMTVSKAVDLLMETNRAALEAQSGHIAPDFALSPLAAAVMTQTIRSKLDARVIDAFHLRPDFKDNPFGWLHTRLDPVVERIKEGRGKFIGAVTFLHAANMVGLMLSLKETQKDLMLGDRSAFDKWLPFFDGFWNLAEGVVNLSGLLARSEYIRSLGLNLSAGGERVAVALNGLRGVQLYSAGAKVLAKKSVKYIPFVGPVLAIILEGNAILRAWRTGHDTAVALGVLQVGLSIGLGYLTYIALAGAFASTGIGIGVVLIGAILVGITAAVSAIQIYIARSRIEDFLSQSFWGNGRTLRYWDGQSRGANYDLLESSLKITSSANGEKIREYFEAEIDAFYYLLFSPVVEITEHMHRHGAITRQGDYKVLSEFTSFVVRFPGYNESTCQVSVKVYEVDDRWIRSDKWNDITELFVDRVDIQASDYELTYKYTHFNHGNFDHLELFVEYFKDGRSVTGDGGHRIILDGSSVKELGVDDRLTFEM